MKNINRNIWFLSDPHFYHDNILKFAYNNGQLIRPGFNNIHEMNQLILENCLKVVKPQDKFYWLGDITFRYHAGAEGFLRNLPGHKRLVLGNHDKISRGQHLLPKIFEKIMLWRIFKEWNFICTHVPIREDQLRKVDYNLHGHIHQQASPTPWHINACVEWRNYSPMHLEEVAALCR